MFLLGTIENRVELPKATASKREIANVEMFHTIDFNDNGIKVFRTGRLGKGRDIRLTSIEETPWFDCEIKNEHQLHKDTLKPKKMSTLPYVNNREEPIIKDDDQDNENNSVDHAEKRLMKNVSEDRKAHIPCDNPLCVLTFKTIRGHENHSLANSKCKTVKRSETIEEWFQNKWISKFGVPSGRVSSYRQSRALVTHMESLKSPKPMNSKTENVCEGCAKRPVKKPPKRLNEKQKKYLQDLFLDGIKQKRKARAFDVEKNMRRYKMDNQYVFSSAEWLTEQNIKNYFSRTSLTNRKAAAKKKEDDEQEAKTAKRKANPITKFFKRRRTETKNVDETTSDDEFCDDEELEEEAAFLEALDQCQNHSDMIDALNEEVNVTQLEKCPIKVRISFFQNLLQTKLSLNIFHIDKWHWHLRLGRKSPNGKKSP